MRINFEKDQVDFVKETLKDVDSRSYDPVFKNTIDRVILSSLKEGGTIVNRVVIEESEVYTIMEALQERSEYAQTEASVKEKCTDLLAYINDTTGLSI